MMTQTHVLIGLGLFGRPKESARNFMAIAGGIVPDAAIYVLYAIEKSRGTAESIIWSDVYYSPFWQDAVAWGNSIPLWLLVLAIGFANSTGERNGDGRLRRAEENHTPCEPGRNRQKRESDSARLCASTSPDHSKAIQLAKA